MQHLPSAGSQLDRIVADARGKMRWRFGAGKHNGGPRLVARTRFTSRNFGRTGHTATASTSPATGRLPRRVGSEGRGIRELRPGESCLRAPMGNGWLFEDGGALRLQVASALARDLQLSRADAQRSQRCSSRTAVHHHHTRRTTRLAIVASRTPKGRCLHGDRAEADPHLVSTGSPPASMVAADQARVERLGTDLVLLVLTLGPLHLDLLGSSST